MPGPAQSSNPETGHTPKTAPSPRHAARQAPCLLNRVRFGVSIITDLLRQWRFSVGRRFPQRRVEPGRSSAPLNFLVRTSARPRGTTCKAVLCKSAAGDTHPSEARSISCRPVTFPRRADYYSPYPAERSLSAPVSLPTKGSIKKELLVTALQPEESRIAIVRLGSL